MTLLHAHSSALCSADRVAPDASRPDAGGFNVPGLHCRLPRFDRLVEQKASTASSSGTLRWELGLLFVRAAISSLQLHANYFDTGKPGET
jgi:hypothetical protein